MNSIKIKIDPAHDKDDQVVVFSHCTDKLDRDIDVSYEFEQYLAGQDSSSSPTY